MIERESATERIDRIQDLTDEQRRVLVLAAAGYRAAEIAAALGASKRVARKRIEYGNRVLRDASAI